MEFQYRMPKRVRREVVLIGGDRHEDGGLINLPTNILHTIMLHVSQNLKDHFNAIAAIRTLRRVADDESFLRGIDLYTIQYPWVNDMGRIRNFFIRCHHADDESFLRGIDLYTIQYPWVNDMGRIRNFFIRCHHAGNLYALFIHVCSQFFHKHYLENGLAMIREAALSRYELAIYFYSNLMRILSPDLQIDLELVNPSRDLVRRMRMTVETSPHHLWAPDPMPQLYLDRCEAFDSSIIRLCHCAWNEPWEHEWVESVKDPWMCDLYF